MEKLFTITCTTCRARLAVRAEAAIGAILECPRCESMVHIEPPEGWKPTPLHGDETPPADLPQLPPLNRVADSMTLDLEPARSPLAKLLHQRWLVWGAAPIATVAVVIALLWFSLSRHAPTPIAFDSEGSAVAAAQVTADLPSGAAKPQSVDIHRGDAITTAAGPQTLVAADSKAADPGTKAEKTERPASQTTAAQSALASSTDAASTPSPKTKSEEPEYTPPATRRAAEVAADGAQPIEIKKAPPARIDVAARWADPVAQIDLSDVPLAKAVDVLAAMSTLPITLDAEAMQQLGVTTRDPISMRLATVSLGKALQAVAASRGLVTTTENGQVLLTASAEYRETFRKVRYTVSDLTGDEKDATAELAALVRRLVAPESWQGNSGRGTIETDLGGLIVVQTGDVHQQVLVFCEKLRNARQKPLRSHGDPQRFALTTRLDQARKMLDRPITATFHQPTPLATILSFLAGAVQGDILVDRAALATAETSDHVEASLAVEKETLATALAELLRPLGLAYRAVGVDAIQVTTKEAAEERLELEFYPVGPLLAKGTAGPALADRLKATVASNTWSQAGGPGEVHFDPPSQCLIVLQSQAAQASVEQLLTAKGNDGQQAGK